MTATVLASLWAAVVVGGAWRRRPLPSPRRAALRDRGVGAAPSRSRHRSLGEPVERAGALIRRVAHRPADPAADRRLGAAVLAGGVWLVTVPLLSPLVAVAVWARPLLTRRRDHRRARDAVVAALPDVADLFRVAVGAGLTVPLALAAVAPRIRGPTGDALRRAAAEVALGRRTADVLADLPARLGEPVRPVVAALAASERYGTPLVETLDRLASDVRLARRRAAEEAARRVPVQLLFPLVLLILPAFALLTVVPLLAGAVGSLRL